MPADSKVVGGDRPAVDWGFVVLPGECGERRSGVAAAVVAGQHGGAVAAGSSGGAVEFARENGVRVGRDCSSDGCSSRSGYSGDRANFAAAAAVVGADMVVELDANHVVHVVPAAGELGELEPEVVGTAGSVVVDTEDGGNGHN